jgi:hypothetical protein
MGFQFLGDTKGNRDLCPCQDVGEQGGAGESHAGGPSGQFNGPTKGNKDLPIDRSAGVKQASGRKVAGGSNAGKPGY